MAVGPLLAQLGTSASVHFRHVDDGGMNREVIWLRRAVVVVIIIISLFSLRKCEARAPTREPRFNEEGRNYYSRLLPLTRLTHQRMGNGCGRG